MLHSKLSAARVHVREQWPWFVPAVLALRVVECTDVATAAVTQCSVLFINPEYAARLSHERLAAVLCHEALHVIRDHHGRAEACVVNDSERALWNQAADAEINDDLAAARMDVGADWIYPKNLSAQPGRTAEEYFAALLAMKPSERPRSAPEPGRGQCGSGAGNAAPGEPSEGTSGGNEPTPGEGPHEPGKGAASHAVEPATPAELNAVREAFAAAVVAEHAKGRGTIAAGLARWAAGLLQPPRVRWQDQLRRVVGRAIDARAGSSDRAYDRPSRRQGALGFGANRPLLARGVEYAPRVAVAIDTSGSMSAADLARALVELRAILRAASTPVQLVTCDAEVSGVATLASDADFKRAAAQLRGGGGTSFIPVMRHFESLPQSKRPQVLIYLTDGDGESPAHPPRGMRVVWVVVRPSGTTPREHAHLARSGAVIDCEV